MKREFVDTDALLEERTGYSIPDYIRLLGWDSFRELERHAIEEVAALTRIVIATGGGVVLSEENVDRLKGTGRLIWLKADPKVLKARMMGEQSVRSRPSLTGTDPLEEIETVLAERASLYEKAGDFSVDTGALSVHDVAEIILEQINMVNQKCQEIHSESCSK
jgi:shikimate kinase